MSLPVHLAAQTTIENTPSQLTQSQLSFAKGLEHAHTRRLTLAVFDT